MIVPDRSVKSIILPARSVLVTELPPRTNEPKEPFSTIISEHAAEISSWTDRRTITYSTTTNVPYKFELILRGTKDGFSPQTFWNICHGHKGTVVIIKIKGTYEVIGGYNPLTWDNTYINNNFEKVIDSFIFSLKNGNIQHSILSRVKDSMNSICNVYKHGQKEVGPHFGDFYLHNTNSSFCQIRTSNYFSIVNYEVFKVIKQ
ncbi:hypothetical protein Glove_294g158 [Diversispora epigaea]|uniref:TLDc domain-containing protein n=1 Tax=Diversispora epigaea TaxID=1348612 RepID=A0A397I5P5_9GLOM|nr:hypothetical protein Glove_294g158 [Diversispora epigaea]